MLRRPSEPSYQGRKLSAWLKECSSQPANLTAEQQRANAALRAMGTNALPAMVRMIEQQDPAWLVRSVTWLHDKAELSFSPPLPSDFHNAVVEGFGVLGPMAEPVIPQLEVMWNSTNETVHHLAWEVLYAINSPQVVAVCRNALTNSTPGMRADGIGGLGVMGGRAEAAVPDVIRILPQATSYERRQMAFTLGRINRRPEQSVAALRQLVRDSDYRVSGPATWALGAFGPLARDAVPELISHLTSSNEAVRSYTRQTLLRIECEFRDGGIIRGPKNEKKIALVFTGHEFAEGGETILNELSNHTARASFFLTGDFLDRPENDLLARRIGREGHFLGPHSDKHLLYCSWDREPQTLVTEREFFWDVSQNESKCGRYRKQMNRQSSYFLPAYEHFNRDITDWTRKSFQNLICYTPGTLSQADCTLEADSNFVSSQAIFDSVLKREQEDPQGLNGFILLFHVGSGPRRADKFHPRLGELLDALARKGYQFVRVDELLEPPAEAAD